MRRGHRSPCSHEGTASETLRERAVGLGAEVRCADGCAPDPFIVAESYVMYAQAAICSAKLLLDRIANKAVVVHYPIDARYLVPIFNGLNASRFVPGKIARFVKNNPGIFGVPGMAAPAPDDDF